MRALSLQPFTKYEKRTCPECKGKFFALIKEHRYCSSACRARAFYWRKKLKNQKDDMGSLSDIAWEA